MQSDAEGFFYPILTNPSWCAGCGLCESVCQVTHPYASQKSLNIYGAYNNDEPIRKESSSGGVFSALGEKIIERKGVVFGARFTKDWQVEIGYTEDFDGLANFRGSKYVQASVGNTFKECESFLKRGRLVLYSGTPCQISGLKRFLNKDYSTLLTVACACHGVPSPLVWSKYLDEISEGRTVESVNFRDKRTGWTKYSFTVSFDDGFQKSYRGLDTSYMKGFVQSLFERPSCSNCSLRSGESCADIVLSDYWGLNQISHEHFSDIGVGLVQTFSILGQKAIDELNLTIFAADFDIARKFNAGLNPPSSSHPNRRKFFKLLRNSRNVSCLIESMLKPTVFFRLKTKFGL